MAVSHSFRHSRGLQFHRAAETLISIHVGVMIILPIRAIGSRGCSNKKRLFALSRAA